MVRSRTSKVLLPDQTSVPMPRLVGTMKSPPPLMTPDIVTRACVVVDIEVDDLAGVDAAVQRDAAGEGQVVGAAEVAAPAEDTCVTLLLRSRLLASVRSPPTASNWALPICTRAVPRAVSMADAEDAGGVIDAGDAGRDRRGRERARRGDHGGE